MNATATPKFSVILPTYNGADFVTNALDSIENQSYDDFELIISDDNSQDETVSIIENHELTPEAFIKQNENIRIARNMNRAVSEASGDYIAFLDQDDEWRPQKLSEHAEAHQYNEAKIVYSDLIIHDETSGTSTELPIQDPKPSGEKLVLQLLKHHNLLITMSSVSIKRKIWNEHGGFDDHLRLACDYDL